MNACLSGQDSEILVSKVTAVTTEITFLKTIYRLKPINSNNNKNLKGFDSNFLPAKFIQVVIKVVRLIEEA